jgi:hypothetical protein
MGEASFVERVLGFEVSADLRIRPFVVAEPVPVVDPVVAMEGDRVRAAFGDGRLGAHGSDTR